MKHAKNMDQRHLLPYRLNQSPMDENYSHGNNSNKNDDVKQLKQELADLLEEYTKADKLRSLPLYSCSLYVQNVMIRSTTITCYYKEVQADQSDIRGFY